MPKHANLSKLQTLFLKKKGFLFDLDGTLYLGKKPLPGAIQLIGKLRNHRKKIIFFTNNSSRSVDDYVKKLNAMGFSCFREQILMSTHSLIRYLLTTKRRRVFLLGTKSMRQMLQKEKIVHTKSDPSAVVVGFDKTLTYQKLLDACRFIERGIPWIVTHPDVYCPTNEGLEPDCGAIAALIASATRTRPEVVLGKPHPSMIDEALKRLKLHKNELVLIGDRLSTDIAMAHEARIDGLLVLSGETTAADLKKIKKKRLFGIVSSVQDLIG